MKNFLLFFRKVDLSIDAKSTGITGFCRDLTGIFSTVFRASEGYSRSITILLMVALHMYTITIAYKTDYLFTRKVFGWGLERFTQISTLDQGRFLGSVSSSRSHNLRPFVQTCLQLSIFIILALTFQLSQLSENNALMQDRRGLKYSV